MKEQDGFVILFFMVVDMDVCRILEKEIAVFTSAM